jgi:hypothetical protein
MKKTVFALLLSLASLALAPSASGQWNQIAGVGADSSVRPGAASFDSKMWVFFRRNVDGQIGYVTTSNIDGGGFSGVTVLPGAAVNPEPSAVAFNGRLYLFYAEGSGSGRLFYRSIGTTGSWTLEQQVPGAATHDPAGLAVFNGTLYIVWEPAGSDNRIKYSTLSPSGVFSGVQTPFGLTTRGPAAAVFNNRLYVVYTGQNGPRYPLYYTSLDTNGVWSPHFAVGGNPRSSFAISVGPFRGNLQIYYTGADTFRLLNKYLTTSGLWSPEVWLAGLGAFGGTTAANFSLRQWVLNPGSGGAIFYIVLS